ncbi:MAG: bifunctional diguanylate cyclase/phosphohydrolase [Bacillota bacterium]
MNHYEDSRQKKIYETISIVKLLSILICGIIIFSVYGESKYHIEVLNRNNIDIIAIGLVSFVVLLLIYQSWFFSSSKKLAHKNLNMKDLFETFIFITVFTILIIFSGGHQSQHKIIFLFIIITSTMQFGTLYGMLTAGVSGSIVLLIDFFAIQGITVNTYFETDLVLVAIFLLTAWLLGDYVKVEKDFREYLRGLVNKDELTGLFNHRYFQDVMSREIERAEKIEEPVSLLFIDIDYFKLYNDLYGHLQGDQILKELGHIINKCVRTQDIVSRYGGEEFAVIMPDTTEEEAMALGEKIRKSVENQTFHGEENMPSGKLTVSIGISSYPEKAKNKLELINSTDDALYRAKFFNKNRVEIYVSILEELKNDIETEHIDLISSIKTLISVINAKDRYTYGHTERVVIYCGLAAEKLGLSEDEKRTLKYGAYLHDIGKIQIPKDVLNKRMRLTDEEWQSIKQHPEHGVDIIKPVTSLDTVVPLILHHHERFDGNGYPGGLMGESIPYLARVLSVADSFDAMTSNRPYQTRKSYEQAIEELQRCSGSQFDPQIVKSFIEVIEENYESLDSFKYEAHVFM